MRGEERLAARAGRAPSGAAHERDVAFAARDAIQRREPLGHEVLVRREMVVRQRFPVREDADCKRRREPRDFRGETLCGERVGAHDRRACAALRVQQARSAASASESPDSGSAGNRMRRPPSGSAGASAGSVANGVAIGIGAAAGSRVEGLGAEAAVAASVEAVGMRNILAIGIAHANYTRGCVT